MQPQHWPSFLRQIFALEQSWNMHRVSYPRDDAVHFLPLPIPQFIALLADAVMAVQAGDRPARFLDVGCGTGTKIQLAQALFDLDGFGIDIVPAFIAEAKQAGVTAWPIDAFEFAHYGAYDILFVNQPSNLRDELEPLICKQIAPEAVLMAVNWSHNPSEFGLEMVTMEYERPVCGVWRKPA